MCVKVHSVHCTNLYVVMCACIHTYVCVYVCQNVEFVLESLLVFLLITKQVARKNKKTHFVLHFFFGKNELTKNNVD